MKDEKMNMQKVLAILAQPRETPSPLENVERIKIEIPYITKEETADVRRVRVVLPKNAMRPMPLVYIPHYEMGEDSLELRDYLNEGWAVACPDAFKDLYNAQLTDDDLVFNNAALYALRHRPEFDKNRIVLAGGSAGAYMTGMLNGLQLGLCASVANGMIANVYFNFCKHFIETQNMNLRAYEKMAASDKSPMQNAGGIYAPAGLSELPVPFIAALYGQFSPIMNNFPDPSDTRRWELLSPVGLAERFSSPIMINHCTSDILVPVDQITKKFTYARPGSSLPSEYDCRLSDAFPGKLKYSLEECLPKAQTRTIRIPVPENAEESDLPFDSQKRFNINIYDDGPVEGYGTHSARMDVGRRRDVPYLKEMIGKSAAKTCQMMPEMLKSLILRYQGKSVTLPAHTRADQNMYGSLSVYRKEVREELNDWIGHHGMDAFSAIADKVFAEADDSDTEKAYRRTIAEIIG